jgi:hypothetical protein
MATEKIGQAIEEHIASLPDQTDGQGAGMLGDWIAVVSMVSVDDAGQPRTQYYLVMREGNMLPHVAKGLLYEGIDEADRGTVED